MRMKATQYSGKTTNEISERELKSRVIAREAARDGMVLLKNDGMLPIPLNEKIALFGSGARHMIKGGTGSGDVNTRHTVCIEEGLLEAGYVITTSDWLNDYDDEFQKARKNWKEELLVYGNEHGIGLGGAYFTCPAFRPPTGRMITEEDIKKANTDIAIYVISRTSGEGADRHYEKGDYLLLDEEKQMIKTISQAFQKTLLIINTGGVIDLSILDEVTINGLIYMGQPGMEGGCALADLLSGEVTPSARLTSTWAKDYKDYPNANTYSHCNNNVIEERYEEGIYVGYRYFDSFKVAPRFAFGFGLSYTEFTMNVTSVTLKDENVIVNVAIKNNGHTYSGREVVQIYASCPSGKLHNEYQRLTAFGKTKVLSPQEEDVMQLTFSLDLLASYDTASASYIMEQGDFILRIGNSSDNTKVFSVLRLEETIVLEKLSNISPLFTYLNEITPKEDDKTEKEKVENTINEEMVIMLDAKQIRRKEATYDLTAKIDGNTNALVSKLSKEQLATLVCGAQGNEIDSVAGIAALHVPGAAGETTGSLRDEYNLPSIVLADGPAGIRISDRYQVNKEDGTIYKQSFFSTVEQGFLLEEEWIDEAIDYYQYCSAIPIGIMLAQTFDLDLIGRIGRMIGEEMDEFHITLWLAPGMNIHRNPLCGRNFEYYSEDPLVSGLTAAAITNGVQSLPGVGTTIKHFACNNQEDNRRGSNSIVSERALREIYLKGFEIAVKMSQPMSIMTSYNSINGVHAANNYDICTKVARGEWGFQGMIMTDWTTTNCGGGSSAAKCMSAGNDLIMPGSRNDIKEILEALDGSNHQHLSLQELQTCAARVIQIILKSNQFEDAKPYANFADTKKVYMESHSIEG